MTPRERVLTALRRQEPDRVPMEFSLCPSQMERFRKEAGANSPSEYFGFGIRGVGIRGTKLIEMTKVKCEGILGFMSHARCLRNGIFYRRAAEDAERNGGGGSRYIGGSECLISQISEKSGNG